MEQNTKRKIIYSFYDYKTSRNEFRKAEAVIHEDGAATIVNKLFGNMKFKPGEYLLDEHFSLYWKRCIEQLATDKFKELKEREGKVNVAA